MRKINIMYIIRLLAFIILAPFFSVSAGAVGSVEDSVMQGLRGGLEAVSLPLRVARERAEDLYIYNSVDALSDALDLVGTNDYINDLVICNGYFVKLTFVGASFDSGTVGGTDLVVIPKSLQNTVIYLVPVYNDDPSNDAMITTWECVSNFTLAGRVFQGDAKTGVDMDGVTTTATRSLLTKYTDDPILEKCIYASGTVWDAVESAAGDCTP